MANCTGHRCESFEASKFYLYTIKPDRSQIAILREGLISEILETVADHDVFAYLSGTTSKLSRKRLKRMRTDDLYDLLESLS